MTYNVYMRANPGGEIAPENVIGRDEFIARLWHTLEQQSVLLVSERRFGKTSLTKKMRADGREGWITIWRDLEDAGTSPEFAERVCRGIEEHLTGRDRAASRVRAFLKEISGLEIKGVVRLPDAARPHWKTVLEKAFEDLAEAQTDKVLFVWDELPFMLQKVIDNQGEQAAMDILDFLRHLRQTHGRQFPMVYCGSIGIHHVVRRLRIKGHTNPALNDLQIVELPPLAGEYAVDLGRRLIDDEGIDCEAVDDVAAHISELVDGVPFFIHSIVQQLQVAGQPATKEGVERIVARFLAHEHDPWHLRHYHERLRGYYGETSSRAALLVLDEFAASAEPLTASQVHKSLRSVASSTVRIGDLDELRDLLQRLAQDHYLSRAEDGRYSFRFPMIRRWWRVTRDLA